MNKTIDIDIESDNSDNSEESDSNNDNLLQQKKMIESELELWKHF